MPERFSFSDDPDREERLAEVKRQCEEWQRQEQEFLTSLTPHQLQTLYDQMLSGAQDDRIDAILKWAGVAKKHHFLLPDVRQMVAAVDSFKLLSELITHDSDFRIRRAALLVLYQVFAGSRNAEVSRFLANLVVDETVDRALRLCSYVGLWTVNRDEPRLKRKLSGQGPPRLKPSFTEYVDAFLERSARFREDSEHFMRATRRDDFSLEHDVRWDWVAEFLQDQ